MTPSTTRDPSRDGPSSRPLSARERLFVEAYVGVARYNATRAAELAGYSTRSRIALRRHASDVLARPRVAAAIAERLEAKVRQLADMDGDEALRRVAAIARADIRTILPPRHRLRGLPDEAAIAIRSIRPTRYGLEIQLHDSLRALELILKAAGKIAERHQITLEDVLEAAYQTPADPPAGVSPGGTV
jgi:phage terminase small subunit